MEAVPCPIFRLVVQTIKTHVAIFRINAIDKDGTFPNNQVYYYIVDSIRNEGKDSFEINSQSGEVFTKMIFDRETKGAFALEVEARDGAPSARPNSGGKPNTGRNSMSFSQLKNHGPFILIASNVFRTCGCAYSISFQTV